MPSIKAAALLKERITELEGELAKLADAHSPASPTGAGPPRPRPPARLSAATGTGTARPPAPPRRHPRRPGVKLIKAQPRHHRVGDRQRKMKIKPNYLYRVLGDLQKEGKVKKSGRSVHRGAEAVSTTEAGRRGSALGPLETPSPADRVALLRELVDRGVDPLAREVVDLEALDDLSTRRPSTCTGSRR